MSRNHKARAKNLIWFSKKAHILHIYITILCWHKNCNFQSMLHISCSCSLCFCQKTNISNKSKLCCLYSSEILRGTDIYVCALYFHIAKSLLQQWDLVYTNYLFIKILSIKYYIKYISLGLCFWVGVGALHDGKTFQIICPLDKV